MLRAPWGFASGSRKGSVASDTEAGKREWAVPSG
jgi:hypothetical protein